MLFYVKIPHPMYWRKNRVRYEELEKRGFPWAIYLVENGTIKGGLKEEIRYEEYQELFIKLPSYKGVIKKTIPARNEKLRTIKVLDLYRIENNQLAAVDVYAQILEEKSFFNEDGKGIIILCKDRDYYFQVYVLENDKA